jgi:hypothetical protein
VPVKAASSAGGGSGNEIKVGHNGGCHVGCFAIVFRQDFVRRDVCLKTVILFTAFIELLYRILLLVIERTHTMQDVSLLLVVVDIPHMVCECALLQNNVESVLGNYLSVAS